MCKMTVSPTLKIVFPRTREHSFHYWHRHAKRRGTNDLSGRFLERCAPPGPSWRSGWFHQGFDWVALGALRIRFAFFWAQVGCPRHPCCGPGCSRSVSRASVGSRSHQKVGPRDDPCISNPAQSGLSSSLVFQNTLCPSTWVQSDSRIGTT